MREWVNEWVVMCVVCVTVWVDAWVYEWVRKQSSACASGWVSEWEIVSSHVVTLVVSFETRGKLSHRLTQLGVEFFHQTVASHLCLWKKDDESRCGWMWWMYACLHACIAPLALPWSRWPRCVTLRTAARFQTGWWPSLGSTWLSFEECHVYSSLSSCRSLILG